MVVLKLIHYEQKNLPKECFRKRRNEPARHILSVGYNLMATGHYHKQYFDSSTVDICVTSTMTSSNGKIFHVTGLLCGEFTAQRRIPRTKDSDAELWCVLWSAPVNWWFETPSRSLWRHCYGARNASYGLFIIQRQTALNCKNWFTINRLE